MRRKTILKSLLAIVLVIGIYPGYIGYLNVTDNFHEIVPGEFYRSAQVSPEDIKTYHHKYGIKSIINLRGSNPQTDWYPDEIKTATSLGIAHYDIPLSSRKMLTPEQISTLLTLMKQAPKPLLVHCAGGSDRSGLASALYTEYLANWPHQEAKSQLSLRYGHIPLPFLKRYAMDKSFEEAHEKLPSTACTSIQYREKMKRYGRHSSPSQMEGGTACGGEDIPIEPHHPSQQ